MSRQKKEFLDCFPATLWQIAEAKGFSRESLSEVVGVGADAVGKWLRGESEPGLKQLVDLAHELGVSTDALLGRTSVKGDTLVAMQLNLPRYRSHLKEMLAGIDAVLVTHETNVVQRTTKKKTGAVRKPSRPKK